MLLFLKYQSSPLPFHTTYPRERTRNFFTTGTLHFPFSPRQRQEEDSRIRISRHDRNKTIFQHFSRNAIVRFWLSLAHMLCHQLQPKFGLRDASTYEDDRVDQAFCVMIGYYKVLKLACSDDAEEGLLWVLTWTVPARAECEVQTPTRATAKENRKYSSIPSVSLFTSTGSDFSYMMKRNFPPSYDYEFIENKGCRYCVFLIEALSVHFSNQTLACALNGD